MLYIQNQGYVDVRGAKVCSKREMALQMAKVHGYHGESAQFTRLIIESRVNRAAMNEAYRNGAALKAREGAQ